MEIEILINDFSCIIQCGPGNQTCQWLAEQAKLHYSEFAFVYPESILIQDAIGQFSNRQRFLLPFLILKEFYAKSMIIQFILKDESRKNEKTNWERCFIPSGIREITISIDNLGIPDETDHVELWGNFNCWYKPIFMKNNNNKTNEDNDNDNNNKNSKEKSFWKAKISFPIGGLLEFRFIIGNQEYLSNKYSMDYDDFTGQPLNWMIVPPFGNSKTSVREHIMTPKRKMTFKKAALIVKKLVRSPNKCTKAEKLVELFVADWKKVCIQDIVKHEVELSKIREKCRESYVFVSEIYKSYCSHLGFNWQLNKVGFANFCHDANLVCDRLPVSQCMAIYDEVDLERIYVPSEDGSRGQWVLQGAADRVMCRYEFLEACVRISRFLYPSPNIDISYFTLYETHLFPLFTKTMEKDKINLQIKQIVHKNKSDLKKLFVKFGKHTYKSDKNRMDDKEWDLFIRKFYKKSNILNRERLSKRKLLTCFYLSQKVIHHIQSKNVLLHFQEFLDAICYFCVKLYEFWVENKIRQNEKDSAKNVEHHTEILMSWMVDINGYSNY